MDPAERTRVDPPSGSSTYDGFISYSHAADDLLAPRLQAGLQRFAKPWWKRRAIRVFRDESSLAANPHLWSSITQALDDSSWFVLLLSEDAASSEWVGKEIEHWIEHKPSDRILPVVTDGTFGWENGDVTGSSVPPALHGVFGEEPRWVDLRFARGEEHLDLQNPDFSAAIADVASAIRGVPKDELASEEVKQHRRTVRTAWAAGIAVTVLAVAALVAGVFAIGQRNEARDNADEAERQAAIAQQNADEAAANAEAEAEARAFADQEADRANRNEDEAVISAQLARARELAASAIGVLDNDPVLSILLALESLHVTPEGETELFESTVALRRAMNSQNLMRRIPLPESSWVGTLSPDGTKYLWTSDDSETHTMLDLTTGEELWTSEPGVNNGTFSHDGRRVAYGVSAGVMDPARIIIVDAASGEIVNQTEIPGCTTAGIWGGSQSPDATMWAFSAHTFEDCSRGANEATDQDPVNVRLLLLDADTLETESTIPIDEASGPVSWLPDGKRVVVSSFYHGFKLIDVATGETLAELPGPSFWSHIISPDGSLIAGARFADPSVWLLDTETLTRVDLLTGLPDGVEGMRFSEDGRLLIAGSRSEKVLAWDVETGEQVHAMTQTGPAWSVDLDPETQHLYVLAPNEISVWDLSGARQGELGTTDIGAWVNANSIFGNDARGAFLSFPLPLGCCGAEVGTFDPRSGALEASIAVEHLPPTTVLPDGRVVIVPLHSEDEVGPIVAWNPDDNSTIPLVGCRAIVDDNDVYTCLDDSESWLQAINFFVDPAGTSLLISTDEGEVLRFDAQTLELQDRQLVDENRGLEGYGAGAIVLDDAPAGSLIGSDAGTIVDEHTLEPIRDIPLGTLEFSKDASQMAVHDNPGQITIYDTTTWEPMRSFGAGESKIRGLEFSPDGTLLASGGTDGFLRVWDVQRGEELHRIPIESPSDAFWLDDKHLAVGTSFGLWTTVTLDFKELVEIAISRLTRGFTEAECVTYQIEPCPTLDDVRGR